MTSHESSNSTTILRGVQEKCCPNSKPTVVIPVCEPVTVSFFTNQKSSPRDSPHFSESEYILVDVPASAGDFIIRITKF